jgi:uncharacterized protein
MTLPPPALPPLQDSDITRLQTLLDTLPAPLEPLDTSALDGYLCGVLLQPRAVPTARWLPPLLDLDGRAVPATAAAAADEIAALARRRHAELDAAITRRDWFDPWIYPSDDDDASTTDTVLPWVAGFATATTLFPELTAHDDPALVEPLALVFLHVDAADLEDADALLAVIETLEPPADLAEAVQDLVRAVMLMADVTRPRPQAAAARRGGATRPSAKPSRTPTRSRR